MEISSAEILEPLKKYLQSKVAPNAAKDDEEGKFRREYFTELGKLGMLGIPTSEELGGAGLSFVTYTEVVQEIAMVSSALAVTVAVNGLPQTILSQFGTKKQQMDYVPKLASGEYLGSFCLSEAGSGSDAKALKTTATIKGDKVILNGTKMWVSNGGESNVYIVMAKESADTISSFIVPSTTKGIQFGKLEDKMGIRASATRVITFDNVEIPLENRVGKSGDGFKIALTALNSGRITISATANGISTAAINEAVKYMKIREQFGKRIIDFQGLQFILADLATELEAAKLLTHHAANLRDQKKDFIRAAAMAKLKATDVCMEITTQAVQFHGGYGYTKEYPVERYMRDAKILQIVEGTNEIQKIVIARGFLDN